MPKKYLGSSILAGLIVIGFFVSQSAAARIKIDTDAGRKPISPWIYGKNNSIKDEPDETTDWQLYREVGVRMFRDNNGNNCTKYNWRLKLSSHPDWYNNVYHNDWDYKALAFTDSAEGNTQAMFAFQLLGKAASSTEHNFDDWEYNSAQWWSGAIQNLAGGGVPDPEGGDKALTEGNSGLYLMDWPADSTAAILDHWFGEGGLGLDKSRFLYWNMDNEPDIWNHTHDDVITDGTAEEFMQKYFAVAKLVREKFPEIRLVGPVATNEWQWFYWGNKLIEGTDGKEYPFIEYFIKRVAEEQEATGVRLLDVIDLHFYPSANEENTLQLHRVWYDTTYDYPGANGVLQAMASTRLYIFERCERWLEKYMGPDHGVTMGSTEMGAIYKNDPTVAALWYASHMGTFADHGVEIFTPWTWYEGMYEALHLFSRYAKTTRVKSLTSNIPQVSAYSSINEAADSLTVIFVNRSKTVTHTTDVSLNNFECKTQEAKVLTLSDLPSTETFVSRTENALKESSITPDTDGFTIDLEPYSITAVLLAGSGNVVPGADTLSDTITQDTVPTEVDPADTIALVGDTLYTDDNVAWETGWVYNGALSEESGDAAEGTKNLRFDYGTSEDAGWWSGFGMMTPGEIMDMTKYKYMAISCRTPNPAKIGNVQITFNCAKITADTVMSDITYDINPGNSWKTYFVPMETWADYQEGLSLVNHIQIGVNNKSEVDSGVVFFDKVICLTEDIDTGEVQTEFPLYTDADAILEIGWGSKVTMTSENGTASEGSEFLRFDYKTTESMEYWAGFGLNTVNWAATDFSVYDTIAFDVRLSDPEKVTSVDFTFGCVNTSPDTVMRDVRFTCEPTAEWQTFKVPLSLWAEYTDGIKKVNQLQIGVNNVEPVDSGIAYFDNFVGIKAISTSPVLRHNLVKSRNIHFLRNGPATLSFYSLTGRLVLKRGIKAVAGVEAKRSVGENVHRLPKGFYFVHLRGAGVDRKWRLNHVGNRRLR